MKAKIIARHPRNPPITLEQPLHYSTLFQQHYQEMHLGRKGFLGMCRALCIHQTVVRFSRLLHCTFTLLLDLGQIPVRTNGRHLGWMTSFLHKLFRTIENKHRFEEGLKDILLCFQRQQKVLGIMQESYFLWFFSRHIYVGYVYKLIKTYNLTFLSLTDVP